MSIIIRLQNLPWNANSIDIRKYFQGQTIPDGGVHIVGGENGDAFIAFATDEDGRQAMEKDGGKIKDARVKLLLSSRAEMLKVIEQARNQSIAVQPPPAPSVPPKPSSKESEKRRSSTDRGRSPDRGRSRSPDRGRSRSRSPDRRRERDKSPNDRDRGRRSARRDRSRSRSPRRSRDRERNRDADRHGKRDERRRSEDAIRKQDEDSRVLPTTHIVQSQTQPPRMLPMPNGEMVPGSSAFPTPARNTPPFPSRYPAEPSAAARPPYNQNSQYSSVTYRPSSDRPPQWGQQGFQPPEGNRAPWENNQVPDANRPPWEGNQAPDGSKPAWPDQPVDQNRSTSATWNSRSQPQPPHHYQQQQQQQQQQRPLVGNRSWENGPVPVPAAFHPDQTAPVPPSYQGEPVQPATTYPDPNHSRMHGYESEPHDQRKYDNFNDPAGRQRPYQPASFQRPPPPSVPLSMAPPPQSDRGGAERTRHEGGVEYMTPEADMAAVPPPEGYDRGSYSYPENANIFQGGDYERENNFPSRQHRMMTNAARQPPPEPTYESQQGQARPSGFCVEIRGLSYNVAIRDIQGFLRGIYAPRHIIKIPTEESGYGTGSAFLKFTNEADMIEALNRNKQFLNGRPVEIIQCPESVFESPPVVSTLGNMKFPPPQNYSYSGMKPKEDDLCVLMKGLPYHCKRNDILRFFHGLGILDMYIECDRNNKPVGTAFVEFRTFKDFHAAMALNGCSMGNRYVELSVASKEMIAASRQSANTRYPPAGQDSKPRHPPSRPAPPIDAEIFCAALCGLPPNVTDRDIADFFGEAGVILRAIHIMLKSDGSPSGEAFAEFHNSADFERSMKKAGHYMGPFCISVKPFPYKRMIDILNGPSPKVEPYSDRPLSDPREPPHSFGRPGGETSDKRRYLMETPGHPPSRPLLETMNTGATNSPGPRFPEAPDKGIPTPPGRPSGRGHFGHPEHFSRGVLRPGARQSVEPEDMDICETETHMIETVEGDVPPQISMRPMGPDDRALNMPMERQMLGSEMERPLRSFEAGDRNEGRPGEYPDRFTTRPFTDSPDRVPGRPLHEPMDADIDPHGRHPPNANRRMPRPSLLPSEPLDPRMGALPGRPPMEPSETETSGPPGRPPMESQERRGPLGRPLMDLPDRRGGGPGRFSMEPSDRRGGSYGRPPMDPSDMRGTGPFGRPPDEPSERREGGPPGGPAMEADRRGPPGGPLMELPDRRDLGPPSKRPLMEPLDRRMGRSYGRPLTPDRRLEGPPGRPFMGEPLDRRFDDPSGRSFMEPPDRRFDDASGRSFMEPPDRRFEEPPGRPFMDSPDRRMRETLDRRFEEPPPRGFMEPPDVRMGEPLDSRMEDPSGRHIMGPPNMRMEELPDRRMESSRSSFMGPPDRRTGELGRSFTEPLDSRLEEPSGRALMEPPDRRGEPPDRRIEDPSARPFTESPGRRLEEPDRKAEETSGRPASEPETGKTSAKFPDKRSTGSQERVADVSDKDIDSRRPSSEAKNDKSPSHAEKEATSSSTKPAATEKSSEKLSSRSTSSSSRDKHHEKSSPSNESSSKSSTSKRTHESSERGETTKSDRSHSGSGKSHSSSSSKSHSNSSKSHSGSRTSGDSGKKSSESKDKGKSSDSSHRSSSKTSSGGQKATEEKTEEKSKDNKSSSSGGEKKFSNGADQEGKRPTQHFGRNSYSKPEMDPRQSIENHGHGDRTLRGASSFRPPQSERGRGMQGPGQDGFGKPGCIVQGRNIHFQAGVDELLKFFGDANLTKDCIIRRYTDFGQPTGDVRIAFRTPMDAQRAVRELNMAALRGRPVSLFLL